MLEIFCCFPCPTRALRTLTIASRAVVTTLGTPEAHAASRHGMYLLASVSGASPSGLACSCALITAADSNTDNSKMFWLRDGGWCWGGRAFQTKASAVYQNASMAVPTIEHKILP